MSEQKAKVYLSNAETNAVSRSLLAWLNTYPDKPVKAVSYEYLEADAMSMAMSGIQAAYKLKSYIGGGYLAQYQFKLILRVQPSGTADRLAADETLNAFADWAAANKASLTVASAAVRRIECNTRSSLFAVYNDGSEDHQILMNLTYEVM